MSTDAQRTLAESASSLIFAQETAKLEFASDLHALMQRVDVNQRELADRLGKSQAYVSKALRGDANLTIETMVSLAHECAGRIHIKVTGVTSGLQWLEVLDGQRRREHRQARPMPGQGTAETYRKLICAGATNAAAA